MSYEQFGGMVTISLSEVEQIRYTTRSESSTPPRQPGAKEVKKEDLAARLVDKLTPRTPIETANISVVSITTEAGSGSGFFVSEDGLIVTNRHVVRGSSSNTKRVEDKISEAASRFREAQKSFEQEKDSIDQYARNLEKSKKRVEETIRQQQGKIDQDWVRDARASMREKDKYLAQWRSNYSKRLKDYQQQKREFDTYRSDFRRKNSLLAKQSRFTVTLADGSEKSALLYRVSDELDLALLKLNGYRTPYLEPADGKALVLGQRVFAIGSPLQLNNSVTSGVISNYRGDYVQTNAEIYPGNSGGPLVTEEGRVLGVNTMKMITEKFEGLGFAIHYSRVRSEFDEFLEQE